MAPEDTYNSSAAPRAIAKAERNYRDKAASDRCLLIFGIGDGGGGPGEEHLERLAREKNLQGLSPGGPGARRALLRALREGRRQVPDLGRRAVPGAAPGHLHHAGAQQALQPQAGDARCAKRNGRRRARCGWLACPTRPKRCWTIWREMLLYQFHDILPGSSITRVYDESRARYAELLAQTEQLTADAEAQLHAQVDTSGMAQPVIVTNSLSWERAEWVRQPARWLRVRVPPMGYAAVDAAAASAGVPAARRRRRTGWRTSCLRVTFNADGSTRLCATTRTNAREAIAPGAAGQPAGASTAMPGDAWDFPIALRRAPARVFHAALVGSARRRPAGHHPPGVPLREVHPDPGDRADGRQPAPRLRHAGRLAGARPDAAHVFPGRRAGERSHLRDSVRQHPRGRRTPTPAGSWPSSRCAPTNGSTCPSARYGVALLNDCKYGHKLRGNVLDLNLLRSPRSPRPGCRPGRARVHLRAAAARRRLRRRARDPSGLRVERAAARRAGRDARRDRAGIGVTPAASTRPTSSSRRSRRPRTATT